jgi:hypothetical protein
LREIGFTFAEDTTIHGKLQHAVISWAEEAGIDNLDILPHILRNEKRSSLYYTIDDHFNANSSRFAAEVIAGKLEKAGYLPVR